MKKKPRMLDHYGSGMRKLFLVMKLTLFFLTFWGLSLYAGNSYSQQKKLNLNLKDVSIIQVFDEIERQSEFGFLIESGQLDMKKSLCIQAKNANISTVLDEVLAGSRYTYRIIDRNIVIIDASTLKDQIVSVTGKVTDVSGSSLPGVSVVVKGTTNGNITDSNGKYTLSNVPVNAVLQFSFVGMKTQEVALSGNSILNVTLQEETVDIEEVVAVGYGTVKKKDLTGSVTAISQKELKAIPYLRADDAIQGRTAGVQISKVNGAPGADMKIRIRGANSINGSNEPLYVIDGFIGGNLKTISMNDIESIDILKDASATAIYGSRGANGVVLVTTKRSSVETPVVEFSTSHGVQQVAKTIDVLGAVDFANMVNIKRSILNPTAPAAFSQQEIAEFQRTGGTDWQDEIYRTASLSNYQLSVSGGTKLSKYYLSGNYSEQDGIVVNTAYRKFGIRANMDITFNDKISVGFNFSGTREKSRNNGGIQGIWGPTGAALVYAPTEKVYDANGNFTQTPPYASMGYNPMYLALSPNSDSWNNSILANGKLDYNITKDLKLTVSGGMTLGTGPSFSGGSIPTPGSVDYRNVGANASSYESTSMQNTNILNYTKTFGKHKIIATAIYEQQKFVYKSMSASSNNYPTISMGYFGLSLGKNQYASDSYSEESLQSYVGRVNYSFLDRYLFTATMRADGSSKFRGNNKYGYFPSAAFAWKMSEESFIQNLNLFSDLKFRASYGLTGSQAIGPFATMQLMSIGRNYAMSGTSASIGIGPGSVGNPDLKWEQTAQSDIGLDMSFMNGKISFTADAYLKQTKDLLLYVELPNFTGMSSKLQNIGQIDNKGLEFAINAYPVEGKNFSWKTNFNISFNRTKVVDLGGKDYIFNGKYGGGATAQPTYIIQKGKPLGQFWGQQFDGIWKSNEATEAAKYGKKPGDAKLRDINGDHVADYMVIGNGAPDFTWGFGNTFSYKNFDLVLFFQGVQGNQIFNMMRNSMFGGSGDIRDATIPDVLNRWTPQNENTNIPAFSSTTPSLMQSSVGVENGSYVKLKSLTLGYKLPESLLSRIKIQQARISFSAYNLFTLTNYSGLDPEISTSGGNDIDLGIDNGSYPNPRSFVVGLELKF